MTDNLKGAIISHSEFKSEVLNNSRTVLVYLPPGYDEDDEKRYPVLYVNDGQNIFSTDTSFAGVDWGLDETIEDLLNDGQIRELLVVAIFNTPDRTEEYTYTEDPEEGGGNADGYADFIINELKPFIDATYRTSNGPMDTAIMGSSFGGLFALYVGWRHPDVFPLVAAISPSLWWADQGLIKLIDEDEKERGPERIWLDMGTDEGDDDDYGDEEDEDEDEPETSADSDDSDDEQDVDVEEDENNDIDEADESEDLDEDSNDDSDDGGEADSDEDAVVWSEEDLMDEAFENIMNARMMGEVLLSKGYTLGVDLFYYEDEGGRHDEWTWGNRVHGALMALFPPDNASVEETE